jgi:hypothetical protein
MTSHDVTVAMWENQWGREGLWCRGCRRTTPVAQLVITLNGRSVLHCETCRAHLVSAPSWVTAVERYLSEVASHPATRSP